MSHTGTPPADSVASILVHGLPPDHRSGDTAGVHAEPAVAPVPSPDFPTYMTDDNGAKAFVVQVVPDGAGNGQTVQVWRAKYDRASAQWDADMLVATLSNALQVWVGVGVYNDLAAGRYGNSYLVHTHNDATGLCHYTYIGSNVFSFTTPSPILNYVGTVRNSEVVYSYADTDTALLNLTEQRQVPRGNHFQFNVERANDFFYGPHAVGADALLDNMVEVAKRKVRQCLQYRYLPHCKLLSGDIIESSTAYVSAAGKQFTVRMQKHESSAAHTSTRVNRTGPMLAALDTNNLQDNQVPISVEEFKAYLPD